MFPQDNEYTLIVSFLTAFFVVLLSTPSLIKVAELKKRGQPEIVINRIKRKIDILLGAETQTRTDPKSLPRTPVSERNRNDRDPVVTRQARWRRSGEWR